MDGASEPLTPILTGHLPFILIAAALLTWPVCWALLAVYRRAVRRSMEPSAALVMVLAVAAWSCGSPRSEPRDESGSASAPRPLPKANLSLEDRARWRPVLGWGDSCEEAFQASRAGEDGGLEFYQLSPGESLVYVLCAAGAYQPTFVVVRLDERPEVPIATVLSFDMYRSLDGRSLEPVKETELTGEALISPDQREITVLSVSRQTRDCGIWIRYGLADRAPQPKEVRARLPCPATPGPAVTSGPGEPPPTWELVASGPNL